MSGYAPPPLLALKIGFWGFPNYRNHFRTELDDFVGLWSDYLRDFPKLRESKCLYTRASLHQVRSVQLKVKQGTYFCYLEPVRTTSS